jgi:hypothetical protein
MDEALVTVDTRRQRCGRHRAARGNQRRGEGPAGEPRALRHRGQPQQVVEGGDAAAAEVGDLGKGVVLAAAVVGLQGAAGFEGELGGGEAPGGGAALGEELADERLEGRGSVLYAGARADGGVEGRRVAVVALAAEAPAVGTRSSATIAAIVARRRVRCGLDSILSPFTER